MFNYHALENIGVEKLHNTFREAFSDYQVKIELPILKFEQMLKRRGYSKENSIGAFVDNMLVGFLLNSVRQWDGKLTAYDTGTGVIKKYRNNGVTSNMLMNSIQLLKKMKVQQYLLEVIQTNTSAVHLYKKQGFKISREFDCFNLNKKVLTYKETYKTQHIKMISSSDWVKLIKFWDFEPSWQNSIDSINVVSSAFTYSIVRVNDAIIGYGIIDKNTGDIPQIAVDKKYRGKGVGTSILQDLINSTDSCNISIANVDSKCTSIKEFLMNLGFNQFLKQYEMIFQL